MRMLRYLAAVQLSLVACVRCLDWNDDGLSKRQDAGSSDDQVKCWWKLPSAAIIRDTIYVDGGNLQYVNSSQVSAAGPLTPNFAPKPYTYALNLTSGFTVGQDSKDPPTFKEIPKTYPNLYDGFMAANDYYFLLYAGYIRNSESISSVPDADEIAEYQKFLQGPERSFTEGYVDTSLSDDVTRYVASGAGVNVRELNMSYYFSGLRSPTWGEIKGNGVVRRNLTANTTSEQLISVDMSTEVSPKWTNTTADSPARGRTNPEMVYVPVGKKGALVVVGGVLYPEWMEPDPTQPQVLERTRTAKSFLESVDVYDIDAGKWYLQNTTGDIPDSGMTQFCATVATSSDGSSHQIYMYGGYAGDNEKYSDDVYILSLPSFQWIKAHSGDSSAGLIGHKCLKVLPDQMFVIGGANLEKSCNKNGIVSVFNLNKMSFQDSYDPSKYEDYAVPSAVYKEIGGDSKGGATKTADWADSDLRTMFMSDTPSETAVAWYPYQSTKPSEGGGGSGTPKYVWPLVGTLIGVLLAVLIGCLIFVCIRRRKRKHYEQEFSEGSGPSFSVDKASESTRLRNWLGGITPGLSGTDAAASTVGDHPSHMSDVVGSGRQNSSVSPVSRSVSGSIVPTNSSAYGDYYASKDDQVHELPAMQEVMELDSAEVGSPEKTLRPAPGHLQTPAPNAPVPNTPIDPSSPSEGLQVAPERIEIKPDTPVERNFGPDLERDK